MQNSAAKNSSDAIQSKKRDRRRLIVDHIARWGVGFGGIGVIIAITLIFFYLAWVVLPLFKSAQVEQVHEYTMPGSGQALMLAMEEQGEVVLRVNNSGELLFFNATDGAEIHKQQLTLAAPITAIGRADPTSGIFALGLANGTAMAFKVEYNSTYPDGKRVITPNLLYPLGEEPLIISDHGEAIKLLTLQSGDVGMTLVATTETNHVRVVSYVKEDSLFEDEVTFEHQTNDFVLEHSAAKLLMTGEQRVLYVVDSDGTVHVYDIQDKESAPILLEDAKLLPENVALTDIRFLAGTVSLMVAGSDGSLSQWFRVRDSSGKFKLTKIRSFDTEQGVIKVIEPEFYRKSFFAMDNSGNLGLYHATAESTLLVEKLLEGDVTGVAISPRSKSLLVEETGGKVRVFEVENEHPEISWSSLWGKVWYEGYQEPDYVWQSTSGGSDFESKLSLVPLSFGTLKAAFYAMVMSVPLAILGAIFTAYFMAPKLRQTIKPTVEIMEALPTVILGFLAGLWLAPFMETNLPAVFALLVIMPLGVLAFAYLWLHMPRSVRHSIPDGWQPILLIPVVILIAWAVIAASPMMEAYFFGGDMPRWMRDELGIAFDQRNSVVVGLAMGFAVIPTIFSIAEDAIFSVPKHLTNGSLALGATPWQTFVRVVLPTASPGIFSGVMIGFGRAVGETMIVLMATGNTPVMDWNIFQGMRTLSANIAVEMPESEVGGTHYRVLFLAALVLFLFTFFFNTLAEVVRQRLRKKYGSL
ncbi:MAG: ABC transporter permease subunit [Gammaproteobacteria bacterium]|nr:ABC transporter permease subunit [Gammaproteobacteria bacterium]